MSFAIVAEFPLGTYRGRRPDGSVDAMPSPARLHAALLSAAAQGARSEAAGGQLRPNPIDATALRWLEAHPPDAIGVPGTMRNAAVAEAFRAEGFFGVRERRRTEAKRADTLGSMALAAPIAWVWDADPPPDILEAISALCADVSHLGTAESPVHLRVGEPDITHRLDSDASLFSGTGIELDVPRPGRTSALERAHERSIGSVPALRFDRVGQAESAVVAPVDRTSLARARYAPVSIPAPDAPWPTVVLLPVDRTIDPEWRVAWCVALHRALVSVIGDGAPPLVTGQYDQGVPRPANRLAIQYVSGDIPAAPESVTVGALALLVPEDADPADLTVIDRALRSLREVRRGSSGLLRLDPSAMRSVPGGSFWAPVAPGHTRIFVTEPAAIPESRPLRGRSWTVGDAALLSLALTQRDRFPRSRDRSQWYAALADAARLAGAEVLGARKLHTPLVQMYAHHTRPESAVQPYRAVLRVGSLAGDGTLLAIGQTRHLGGGLLVPVDVQTDLVETVRAPGLSS